MARPVTHAVFREVVAYYQNHPAIRLGDKEVMCEFVGRLPVKKGEERTHAATVNEGENRHRFTLRVARCFLYLPTDRLVEQVCHELAHVLLWPLGCDEEKEHPIVEKLALGWSSTIPMPDILTEAR